MSKFVFKNPCIHSCNCKFPWIVPFLWGCILLLLRNNMSFQWKNSFSTTEKFAYICTLNQTAFNALKSKLVNKKLVHILCSNSLIVFISRINGIYHSRELYLKKQSYPICDITLKFQVILLWLTISCKCQFKNNSEKHNQTIQILY